VDTADHLVQALRDAGLRATQARRAVCRVLVETRGEHLTATELLERIEADTPVTLSTVYRTLETLEASGLITHTHLGRGALVYHLADEPPHLHLICARCGTTLAIGASDAATFLEEVTAATGFVPDPTHVALTGLCADCAAE
jgi:Fur family ferric uptake transcriptional regulator